MSKFIKDIEVVSYLEIPKDGVMNKIKLPLKFNDVEIGISEVNEKTGKCISKIFNTIEGRNFLKLIKGNSSYSISNKSRKQT